LDSVKKFQNRYKQYSDLKALKLLYLKCQFGEEFKLYKKELSEGDSIMRGTARSFEKFDFKCAFNFLKYYLERCQYRAMLDSILRKAD